MATRLRIGVVGAHGYIGAQLVRRWRRAGATVRPLVRRPKRGEVAFDALWPAARQQAALHDLDVVYYLVHAMTEGDGFAATDRRAARGFARAAAAAGVGRVIYLGGLGGDRAADSAHLRSRAEVGRILTAGCGAVCVGAGIIIGRGSAAITLIRRGIEWCPPVALLPVARGHLGQSRPIDVTSALRVLVELGRRDAPAQVALLGPDTLTYPELWRRAAALSGRRVRVVTVPWWPEPLAFAGLPLVPEEERTLARRMLESLSCDCLPGPGWVDGCGLVGVRPLSVDRALALAL